MDDISKEVGQHGQVDWKKIKEILCGVASALQLVCDMLPIGIIKTIICGIYGVLNLICQKIPE